MILLDKQIPELVGDHIAVYQNLKWDIYHALKEVVDLVKKYNRLVLVFPKYSHHPAEITEGVLQFCLEHQKSFSVASNVGEETLLSGTAYIVITESDLAHLIKMVRNYTYQLGSELGIISFNETVFKELLYITVISTDFEEMGRSAAVQILNGQVKKMKNSFKLIRRKSL